MAAIEDSPDGDEASDPILETENLTKEFGELTAVDGVDLTVEPGEFRSIIGPNGAGKTTYFNMITGTLRPTRGSISMWGEDITNLSPARRIKKGLGRSFQITTVFNGLTVRENIRLGGQASTYDEMALYKRFLADITELDTVNAETDAVLQQIGLTDKQDLDAANLSHGDLRRLELGLVLATDPDLVLLDEPTAGMSADQTEATIDLIEEVLADRTLLLVEHDVDLVMRISDRITVLHQGGVIADGSPEEIANDDLVQEAYLGGYEQ